MTPTRAVSHKSVNSRFNFQSCWNSHALGGGALKHLVKNTEFPYDVVGIHVGPWDASFTSRNISSFALGLEQELTHLLGAWSRTEVILFTMTPCGPSVCASCAPNAPILTPKNACDWVGEVNTVIWRLAQRHAPRVQVLDAYQMTVARPGSSIAGSPPGIWPSQRAGWHFDGTFSMQEFQKKRNSYASSQAGEMHRALANRLLDIICP